MSVNSSKTSTKKPKIAIFHHFLNKNCKGGGEKLMLALREHYDADLWIGGIDLSVWGPEFASSDPEFVGKVWQFEKQERQKSQENEEKTDRKTEKNNNKNQVIWLHQESQKPIWRIIKRHLFFLFHPKIRELRKYDIVIFSLGNISFVPWRLRKGWW